MNINIEECYKKYAPMVFRRCSSLLKNEEEAHDAAQDVFVNLLRHRGRLHGQFVSSLLYTIATNICLNRLRRRKLRGGFNEIRALSLSAGGRQENERGLVEPYSFEPSSLDPQFDKVEYDMLLEAVLQNESESTRAICFMYHVDEMTLREIREAMGLSISGVRKRLLAFNARAKIKLEGERL